MCIVAKLFRQSRARSRPKPNIRNVSTFQEDLDMSRLQIFLFECRVQKPGRKMWTLLLPLLEIFS